jgi:hypothetical protein
MQNDAQMHNLRASICLIGQAILATKSQLAAREPSALANWMTEVSPPHQWLRNSIVEALGQYEHLKTA